MLDFYVPELAFQSTHPRGVRRTRYDHAYGVKYFNPRTREGCDRPASHTACAVMHISIHAPARGATHGAHCLHVRRRISIHAPARGATDGICRRDGNIRISIHAPARGATFGLSSCLSLHADFNPRTREGCDRAKQCFGLHASDFNPRTREGCDGGLRLCENDGEISIHAPARGATVMLY